jgi:hypothetical protein
MEKTLLMLKMSKKGEISHYFELFPNKNQLEDTIFSQAGDQQASL